MPISALMSVYPPDQALKAFFWIISMSPIVLNSTMLEYFHQESTFPHSEILSVNFYIFRVYIVGVFQGAHTKNL